jgi:hypothetical protein
MIKGYFKKINGDKILRSNWVLYMQNTQHWIRIV